MQLNFDKNEFYSKHEIANNTYYVTPLHEHPELIEECCTLINMEWKRSHVARLRSISGSSENFPTSLILLMDAKNPKVIGHCKLSKLSHSCPAVFVNTVVIHPDYRGIGLGRLLMEKTEQYLKSKHIDWVYLTTVGQELFYQKLGYSNCQPINIYGGQAPWSEGFEKINHGTQIIQDSVEKNSFQVNDNEFLNHNANSSVIPTMMLPSFLPLASKTIPSIPPPPPLPLPAQTLLSTNKITTTTGKQKFMRKKLFNVLC